MTLQTSRAAKRGGFKRGGFPIWTCPSFFVLFSSFLGFFFPDLLGDGPGIFPISPVPLFQTWGFPDLDLSFLFCPFLSFLSRFARGRSGDFPD